MAGLRVRLIAAVWVLGAGACAVHAQLPVPRLNSIYPCGARQGATVECAVAGGDLEGATALHFSHPGITAHAAAGGKFTVSVAKDVPVGPYDVRVVTPLGVSNFRAFVVGDWPEAQKKVPISDAETAQRVTLPVVVNGRIDAAADVDYYVFAARQGQRVLLNCWAARIDSQLDATLAVCDAAGKELAYSGDYYGKDPFIDFTAPADGDYVVKVWDFVYGGGSDYFYRLQAGSLPHIDAVAPAAIQRGQKTTVTIYGRNLPGGKPAPSDARILGRPLEVVTREIEGPADLDDATLHGGEAIRSPRAGLDGMDYRLTTPEGSSNPIFLGFTSDPLVLEQEPNNDLKTAQELPVPCDVTGTFSPVNDQDYYTFPVKKGEQMVVEVYGERQSGTGLVDPFLSGYDPAGKRLVALDDSGESIGQLRFPTSTHDPRWDFTAASDGKYAVCLRDLYHQQRGGPQFTYRLSVRRPRPDFRLIVAPKHDVQPDATAVGRGGRDRMDVLAFRKDGFDGPIRVEALGLPPGVTCDPVVIAPGKTSAPLVFSAAKDAVIGPVDVRVTGAAHIGDRDVVRQARAGGMTWPTVNTPGIARMADGIVLAVRNPAPFTLTAAPAQATAAAGEKVTLTVTLERAADWTDDVQLSGFDLPPNAEEGLATIAKGAVEGKAVVTLPANLRPGDYTFVINGAGQAARDYGQPRDGKGPRGNNVRVVYPSNPITITVTAAAKPAEKK